MAPVHGTVRVLVDSQFTSDQIEQIKEMAAQWNELGQKLRGQDFFSVETADVPDVLRTQDFQTCNVDAGTGPDSFYIVNEEYTVKNVNSGQWTQMKFSDANPGATLRCYVDDHLAKQVMMIRPDLVAQSEFSRVVLHELGHSIGLDHSCTDGSGTSDFVACNELPANSPFLSAVMDPNLTVTSSAQAVLEQNDISRTSCLY